MLRGRLECPRRFDDASGTLGRQFAGLAAGTAEERLGKEIKESSQLVET